MQSKDRMEVPHAFFNMRIISLLYASMQITSFCRLEQMSRGWKERRTAQQGSGVVHMILPSEALCSKRRPDTSFEIFS